MFLNLGMEKSGYAAVSAPSSAANTAPVAVERSMRRTGAGVVGVAALLAVVAGAAWMSKPGAQSFRQATEGFEGAVEAKFETAAPQFISDRCGTAEASSRCGQWENNTEYQVEGGWYQSMDHVPNAEMCCAMCQGVPQCKAFTWVQNAGLDGCASQCWLKGGEPTSKASKPGFVSGLAAPRPELPPAVAMPPATPGVDSMFCWSLIVPGSYEEDLLKFQRKEATSIFACDAWSVYSNVSKPVGDFTTTAVKTSLEVKFGGDSYTALNSWIFIAVWKKVIDEKWHEQHQWIVKVDADAVFFPDRLRPIVAAHGSAGYINNCKYGLHGPIEVLSASTMEVLAADYAASFDGQSPKECVEKLDFGEWGEDFFLSRCMWQIHKITKETDETLMCEAHCDCADWYWCDRPDMVTFHPFKRPDMYKQCMANSRAAAATAAAGQYAKK